MFAHFWKYSWSTTHLRNRSIWNSTHQSNSRSPSLNNHILWLSSTDYLFCNVFWLALSIKIMHKLKEFKFVIPDIRSIDFFTSSFNLKSNIKLKTLNIDYLTCPSRPSLASDISTILKVIGFDLEDNFSSSALISFISLLYKISKGMSIVKVKTEILDFWNAR